MDPEQAFEIVRMLTDGIDPTTGEEFPVESPYQRPRVLRALFVATRALEDLAARAEKSRRAPAKAGRPWTEEEDRRLAERFEEETKLSVLAAEHERTVGAIEARLVRLGKITPPIGLGPSAPRSPRGAAR